MLVDDQRGAEADAGFAAAKDEEAALEGQFDYFVAHGACGGAGLLVFYDLDADHEAAASDVAYGGVFGDPGAEAGEHGFAYGGGILHGFALDDVQRGEGGGDADGVAAEGAGVGARNPVHDLGAGHADAEGHAGGDAFGDADDVGLDAGVLDGPPLAGAADAGLDLVGDEEDSVLVADAADLLEEVGRSDDVAAFALDGFEDDGGDLFGGRMVLKSLSSM